MKLERKIVRIQYLAFLIVIPVSALVMFFSIRYYFRKEVDEKLEQNRIAVISKIKDFKFDQIDGGHVSVKIVGDTLKESINFYNTYDKGTLGEGKEITRELHAVEKINGKTYLIVLHEHVLGNKDFIYVVFLSTILFLISACVIFQLIFWRTNSKIWQPFYKTLDTLKNFKLENQILPIFDKSEIDEFDKLNSELSTMSNKMLVDYKNLKEFSENATHEMHTPLAIMALEFEELLQKELPDDVKERIYKAYQSTVRMSSLVKKLFYISKVDNLEFNEKVNVNLSELFTFKLQKFDLLIKQKKISVKTQFVDSFYAHADDSMMRVLVENLLSNAIKHNDINGHIKIVSSINFVSISNSFTGELELNKLFTRFYKNDQNENSHGLGLSISKQIAEASSLALQAEVSGNILTFSIRKN